MNPSGRRDFRGISRGEMKRLDKAFDNIEEEDMHCPHLGEGKISTCHANPRTVTSRNEYEINYCALPGDTRIV